MIVLVLLLASTWLSIIGAALIVAWLLVRAFRWLRRLYIARRNERQVHTHMRARQGFRSAGRRGWVSEDLH